MPTKAGSVLQDFCGYSAQSTQGRLQVSGSAQDEEEASAEAFMGAGRENAC